MSSNSQYYSTYNKKIIESAREYVNKKSIREYLDNFYITPESQQGQLVLSVLKSNRLLFDDRYLNSNLIVNPNSELGCCVCNTKPYTSWKLIGVTSDEGSEVVKCSLPFLLCEACFRKRFCYQKQTQYLCNIAVFPPVDPPKKKPVIPSTRTPVIVMSNPMCQNNQKPIPTPSPALTKPAPIPTPSPAMEYGVDDVLGESRISDGQSVSNASTDTGTGTGTELVTERSAGAPSTASPAVHSMEDEASHHDSSRSPPAAAAAMATTAATVAQPAMAVEREVEPQVQEAGAEQGMTSLESNQELTFTLPFRQGGFFRTWLMSFFVIDSYSVRMYPNEKRNERKRKEILLQDASVQRSTVSTDSKHPYCVGIRPGPSSDYQKSFVVALPSKEDETMFISTIQQYIDNAKAHAFLVCITNNAIHCLIFFCFSKEHTNFVNIKGNSIHYPIITQMNMPTLLI